MSNQKQQTAPAPKPPAAETQKPVEQPKPEVQADAEQGKPEAQGGEQNQKPAAETPKQEEKPAPVTEPTPPTPEAALPENKLQRDPKLPSDEFPKVAVSEPPAAEAPEAAEASLVSAIDTLLKYLLTDATHWKAGVPEVGDSWQPIYEQVLQGMRPVDGQPIEAARQLVQKHQVVLRCFGGATPKEKIIIVRVMGTKYLRSELLPWTIGK